MFEHCLNVPIPLILSSNSVIRDSKGLLQIRCIKQRNTTEIVRLQIRYQILVYLSTSLLIYEQSSVICQKTSKIATHL